MPKPYSAAAAARPARLWPALTLVISLVALAAAIIESSGLVTPTAVNGALTENARQWSVANQYRDQYDGFQVSAAGWTRQAFYRD